MTIDDLPSADDQRFWLLYAHRSLELLERADQNGMALWEIAQMPKAAAEYATQAGREMQHCLDAKTPLRRRFALQQAAAEFHKRQGWRGEIPQLARSFENALLALAANQVPGKRGDPARILGSSKFPERCYVNKAASKLTDRIFSRGRPDLIGKLWEPGRGRQPSRGRKLIRRYALKLAKQSGKTLDPKKLSVQIREHAKVAATHVNFLALCLHKSARKKRAAARSRNKAAGI
jgi:hypothetical protein